MDGLIDEYWLVMLSSGVGQRATTVRGKEDSIGLKLMMRKDLTWVLFSLGKSPLPEGLASKV